jgi:hypothetical protein
LAKTVPELLIFIEPELLILRGPIPTAPAIVLIVVMIQKAVLLIRIRIESGFNDFVDPASESESKDNKM